MKPPARLAAALAVALLAAWAGSRTYRAVSAARRAEHGVSVPAGEASPPAPADAVLPQETAAASAVKIPDRLPQFTLADRDGKATPIATWQGKSLIINFWATWCAPCRHEIPLLKTVADAWAGRNFEVIGIAVDHREDVRDFARRFAIGYPVLVGEDDALQAAAALGVESPAFPFTVFTDRRGRVVALFLGELHPPEVNLILATVQELNGDRTDLAAARRSITEGLAQLPADRSG